MNELEFDTHVAPIENLLPVGFVFLIGAEGGAGALHYLNLVCCRQ